MQGHVYASLAILSASSALVMAQRPEASFNNQANSYSLEKEMALGRQMAAELHRSTHEIEDASIEEYVGVLGRRLSGAMPGAVYSFTFTVITDDACPPTHEPASLPGGYVFVPAALFLEAQGEAEFAGMVAHSMAHVAVRHATRLASETQPATSAAIPLILAGGWIGSCGKRSAIPLAYLARQRSYELEADSLAVTAMARSGFDPSALVSYVHRVQKDTGTSEQFSPLPTPDERVAAMNLIIRKLSLSSLEVTSSEFVDQQRKIRSLIQ